MRLFFFLLTAVGIPLAFVGEFLQWPQLLMFIIYSVTIVSLATYIGRATESLAVHVGERLGGLLNATFGNAVELIISIFALKAGLISIVLASMTGAVIGNLLLIAGLSFLVGGLKHKRQRFNIYDARHNVSLLMVGIVIAFVFPHVFASRISETAALSLSIIVAVILIILYATTLFFRLVTYRGVYPSEREQEGEEAEWNKTRALLVLLLSTVVVAIISERLVGTFDTLKTTFGWSEIFIGVIIVAIVGNAAEHSSAIWMAYKDRMNVAVEIAIGSSIQIAMFVVPILVLISLLFPTPMALVFTTPELVAMVLSVLLINVIIYDGDTNSFEGVTLLAAYAIMAVGFYLL